MAPPSPSDVASILLASESLHLQSIEVLQSLWAGYGKICRIVVTPHSLASSEATSRTDSTGTSVASTPQEAQSFILKLIAPPPTKANNEGHIRKLLSYQVEQYFYTYLAPRLPPSIPVAKVLTSMNEPHSDGTFTMATILSDLKQDYPIAGEKRDALNSVQVHAALDWLSSFHGFWWPHVKGINRQSLVRPPLEEVQSDGQDASDKNKTVWLNGGYTYLATRQKEYQNLAADHDSEWSERLTDWVEDEYSISQLVASVLAPNRKGWSPSSAYMTLIHGDVKSENLFTSRDGKDIVFYDFQYTGLGLGVCDLAKLFTCSIPLDMLIDNSYVSRELDLQMKEKTLLMRYWNRLKQESGREYEWKIFIAHWETALVDWLRFQASWGFWGNTEWLEARVRSILKNKEWRAAVVGNAKMGGALELEEVSDSVGDYFAQMID